MLAIRNAIKLAYYMYDPAKKIILQVDASTKGYGASLLQLKTSIVFCSKRP